MDCNWTKRDMAEFEAEHKTAYQFLLNKSLFNEYRHLATNEIILNEWQKNRMKELETMCSFTWDDVTRANVKDMFFNNIQENVR